MTQLDAVLARMRARYDDVLGRYRTTMPELVAARTKSVGKFTRVCWTIAIPLFLRWKKLLGVEPLPAYVLQNLRHPDIALNLDHDQVAIIGGFREFLDARRKGIRFVWGGYITRAFELFYWANEDQPLREVIEYLDCICPPGRRILFLWEDSLPAGIVLSHFAVDSEGVTTVCVAHGYYGRSKVGIVPEGDCCDANFVWSESQRKLFSKFGIRNCFVLGVPYDVRIPTPSTDEVVLVGHCGRSSSNYEYFHTLAQFVKIFQLLRGANIKVSYRPHPQDDMEFVRSIFPKVPRTPKTELLRRSRGIYIGFSSSFLFECVNAGSLAIGLETASLLEDRDFEVEVELDPDGYDELPVLVKNLQEKLGQAPAMDPAPLNSRLTSCIDRLEHALAMR